MSLLGRILGRDQAPATQRMEPPVMAAVEPSGTIAPEGWIVDGWGAGQSRVKTLPRVTPDIAQRHATVFACCNIIAGDLSKVPLNVMERNKTTGRLVPVKEHALHYLLNVESTFGVPSIMTRFNAVYSFGLRGNGYAYAPRDGGGQPLLIEYVHNDRCNILRDGRARFYDFEDGAGTLRRSPARSMVHLRYLASDGWTGRSPLSVAAESVGLALAGQEAAARTASGTQVRGAVKLEDNFADEEAKTRGIKRIRAMMNDPAAEGWPVLGANDDIITLDITAADQELLSSRKFDREQLAAIYRVPPSKLQMLEFGVKANGQQQAIDYKTDCLTHWGNMVQDFMEVGLLTRAERERGLQLVHDYDALMEATTKERYEANAKAVGGPWKTVNEMRREEGKEDIEGGDILYPPSNMTRDAGTDGSNKEADK
ncbi:phage portal protein, HK97 family [Thalassovita gelatinovora]|uniref:Phage portal protein, HK97 family n=1 Tax=Thalassovita gelatinovora TaxID=53501 RepID=A0A0P1FKQ0_THAGE|nr:phage portal protein [Thalassovita gelatinovora]QIZ79067.1 phage portal protein [Thalassovita gelatinovora]CUH68676.1 phage portal protein, HK97 family [Thalassovita gelatinovora]SEQ56545.1 phage portal protein, HK97 family [Thalassovita gelatinovora]